MQSINKHTGLGHKHFNSQGNPPLFRFHCPFKMKQVVTPIPTPNVFFSACQKHSSIPHVVHSVERVHDIYQARSEGIAMASKQRSRSLLTPEKLVVGWFWFTLTEEPSNTLIGSWISKVLMGPHKWTLRSDTERVQLLISKNGWQAHRETTWLWVLSPQGLSLNRSHYK